jgi:hypothetical protein
MAAAASARAFGLWDVLDLALADMPPRIFGSPTPTQVRGGIWGDPDMQRYVLTSPLKATGASVESALDRMFETNIGSRLTHIIGDPERTLVALERLSLEAVAETLRCTGEAKSTVRLILAPRGANRSPAVLLLSPDVDPDSPARVVSDLLRLPFRSLRETMTHCADPNEDFPEALAVREILHLGDRSVAEVFLVSQPEIVVTRRPRMIPLCVSSPYMKIELGTTISTAGVLCKDSAGDIGVTGCFHGTGPDGTKVMVGLRQCQVSRANLVQDIVFIPLGEGFNVPQMTGLGGVRTHREPARADYVHFDGATNNNQSTRILGCDNGGQAAWLVNYANGTVPVRTSITEGTANFLVNRRMNKSQQMRWSRDGADLLLQVRCAVYNGTLGAGFGHRFDRIAKADPAFAQAA